MPTKIRMQIVWFSFCKEGFFDSLENSHCLRVIPQILFLACALIVGSVGSSVFGQNREEVQLQTLKNPEELETRRGPVRGGDVSVTLELKYADNTIYNPTTGQYDKVRLRSYNGDLVGPTIRVKPGDTLRVKLQNNLLAEQTDLLTDPCIHPQGTSNIPNCFNTTNLHTHGWHVSPTGNSDNFFLELSPQTTFDFEFNLPKDHPAGTFWYHAHRHGSTALQVSSGMAGTLIVEGDRPLRDKARNGIADIDTILKYSGGKSFDERIFLFEQIPYACLDNAGNIIIDPTDPKKKRWLCPEGAVGKIEQYGPQFGPGTWPNSGRFTMINGKVQPNFEVEAQAGRIERWRMIHAGVRDTIKFTVTRSKIPLPPPSTFLRLTARPMTVAEQKALIQDYCLMDQVVSQWEFAVDGLTRKRITPKNINVFQPGYRSDVLIFFDRPGMYCVIDEQAPPTERVNAQDGVTRDRKLLALVPVRGGTPVSEGAQQYLTQQLLAANADLPANAKRDLEQLSIVEFAPHRDISVSEIDGRQSLMFNLDVTDASRVRFGIDNQAYSPDRIDRTLKLNGVDEWTLTSTFVNHPFHIHVNPFQVIDITKTDKDGKWISIFKDNDYNKCLEIEKGDPQYCDQQYVFRDTLFVKQNYKLIIRSRNERYIGDYVLHCHILDHEDQGMMQNVRVVPNSEVTKHGHK